MTDTQITASLTTASPNSLRNLLRRLPLRTAARVSALRDRILGDIALISRRFHDVDYAGIPISHRHARLPSGRALATGQL